MKITCNVKCVMCTVVLACALHALQHTAFAQSVSAAALINEAAAFDGTTVRYEGEVVGDIMVRGTHAWVNLRDGTDVIGVWISRDAAAAIERVGNYTARGDSLEVVGTFHSACPAHGGDLDIHAHSVRRTQRGGAIVHPLEAHKKDTALLLGGLLCLVMILRRFR